LAPIFVATALATAVAALAAVAPGTPLVSSCAGAGPNHAALVVEHGDGSGVTRCVSFDVASVSGEQLLNLSGVAWSGQSFGSFGEAVCAVDAEPAHYYTCPGKDSYWAVFVSRGGSPWQLTSVGISTLTLSDGDAEGLRYVPAAGSPAAPPSPVGVCGAAGATAAASAAVSAAVAAPTATAIATSDVTAGSGVRGGPTAPAAPTVAAVTATGSLATGVADATGVAATTATQIAYLAANPSLGAGVPGRDPGGNSGIDYGLLGAALTGGALGGLALLRLTAARRRPSCATPRGPGSSGRSPP
jgi:hypothetical protein